MTNLEELTLGQLIREMQSVVIKDPNVLFSEEVIRETVFPTNRMEESLKNREKYMSMVTDLVRREKEYLSYKPAPRY